MKVSNVFATENASERVQRQAAIHRKCLMLLQARAERAPARAVPKGG